MYYRRNTPFPDEGDKKDPNIDHEIIQCANFPSTNPSNLNLRGYIFVCDRYGIPRIPQKNRKEVHYSEISSKKGTISVSEIRNLLVEYTSDADIWNVLVEL